MELRSFSQLHYIRAVKNGSEVKSQNTFKGRPAIKYKDLVDVHALEDARRSGLSSTDEFEIKVEIPCPPVVERRTMKVEFGTESDCRVDEDEDVECDFGFDSMTLKAIRRRCIAKKRKRPDNVEMVDEMARSRSFEDFGHAGFEPDGEMDDHDVPLSSWKDNIKRKMKVRRKRKNKCVCSSGSGDIVVKSEPYQDDECLQLCVVDGHFMPESAKIEPLEIDCSGCQSLVCVSDESSFAADDDTENCYFFDHELPVSFSEESCVYALTLVPHDMDDDEPDTISQLDSCEETLEANLSKVTSRVSGYESDEYTNHPCRDECVNTVFADIPNTSGCNVLQSPCLNDEMPGLDNSTIQVQVPNVNVHVSGSHMLSSDDRECLSSYTSGNGISHSAVYDSVPSDSELCNRSSPAKGLVSREIHTLSESMDSGKEVLPCLLNISHKDDVTLTGEEAGPREPVTLCGLPSDSIVKGTCPSLTAKDCSLSWNQSLPASSESCVVSVNNNSSTVKDPIISDYAANRSVGIQHHDDADEFATSAGNVRSDSLSFRRPRRLLSTRKIVSPASQKRLRQILECIDLEDDEDYKCKEKVCAGRYTPDRNGGVEKPYPNKRSEVTVSPKQPGVTSTPKLIMKKTQNYMEDILPKDTNETQRHSRQKFSTKCNSIKRLSQNATEFSQRQMHDMDRLTVRLLQELKSMKDVVKETLQSEVQPAVSFRYKTDKVQMAIKNATKVEETTRRWLSTMSKDCNRFCKIMALTGEGSAATTNAPQRERKVTFADEVGEELCHVKVFEGDMAFDVQAQQPEAEVSG